METEPSKGKEIRIPGLTIPLRFLRRTAGYV